jgi:hypothetical protein
MVLIKDIAALKEWKISSQKKGCISMRELIGQATQIEQSLENGLSRYLEMPEDLLTGGKTYLDATTSPNIGSIHLITSIFACSALTYLHVVVSGAHPELPEIQESVSRTIKMFKRICDESVMLALTWPFCVTGCMAMGGQENFFRDIAGSAEGSNGLASFGNIKRCFSIVEECWRIRQQNQGESPDWMASMNSLGTSLLLL